MEEWVIVAEAREYEWNGTTKRTKALEVSNLGRVRRGGKILEIPIGDGYLRVGCGKRNERVSRLVAAAFHGPCPEGMECCHADGNPLNNRADNLRWDTPKGNMADKIRHGRTNLGRNLNVGESHYRAVLTDQSVVEMRRKAESGESPKALSLQFGISVAQVRRVIKRQLWKHIL